MARGLEIYLLDVLESVDKIEEYTAGKEEQDFLDDTLLQDAVLRRLEVMGEAVKGMPGDVRKEHPDVPWNEIAGLRDVLIHQYFGVKLERVWRIVENDLPALREKLLEIASDRGIQV